MNNDNRASRPYFEALRRADVEFSHPALGGMPVYRRAES